MSVKAFHHKLTHHPLPSEDICAAYLALSKEWAAIEKADHLILVKEINLMFVRVRSTLVTAFHHKLYHEPIIIEDVRSLHKMLAKEWREIQTYATPQQQKEVREINRVFDQFSRNFLEVQPLVQGQVVSDVVEGDFRTVTSWITVDQLKALPKGYGGRVGAILQTPNKYVFNLSVWDQIADFGGGLKAKHTPYFGLAKELSEECPQWLEYILKQIDTRPVQVSCIETFHRFDDRVTRTRMRFSIIVLVPFDIRKLATFKKSAEVKEIRLVDKSDVKSLVEKGCVNRGIVHLSKVK